MEQIIDFLVGLFAPKGAAVMAWVQFIPAIVSAAGAIYGGISEAKKRKQMAAEREKWNSQNNAWYNEEYSKDYTRRADVQNVLKQMREENDRNRKLDEGKQIITGGTQAQQLAAQERRNRMMANLYSNIAGQGARYKDAIQRRYLDREQSMQAMKYGDLDQSAQSSNNLLYNGIQGLGNMDWAGILGGTKASLSAVNKN